MFRKNNEEKTIEITRSEFRKMVAKVLANPIPEDGKTLKEDESELRFGLAMSGIILFKELEDKIFGEEE